MRKSALALAALFALTGAAFAENPNVGAGQQDKSPVALDLNTTQSVHGSAAQDSTQPRLGYDANPWFIPNAH